MKIQLSNALIHKLCLVQYIFRKNALPDDVFWYMIKPQLQTDITDVCVWYWGEFMSILEYGPNFNVTIKDDGYMFGQKLPYILGHYKQDKFNTDKFKDIHKDDGIVYFISYDKHHTFPELYVVFKIENDVISPYICFNKYNDAHDDINDKVIEDLIKYNALNLHYEYFKYSTKKLRKIGIDWKHVNLLKNLY